MTVKMTVIGNFIVISLALNELSYRGHNLIKKKLKKYIAQNLIFFVICHKRENLGSDFCHFWDQTSLKNRVTMAAG